MSKACRSLRPGILKTKIPHRRVFKKHVGYLHDEKEDPLTAKWLRPAVGDVKRQPAGPHSNVDRRSDASTLQSGFARAEGAERNAEEALLWPNT
jgi:hypothetical protein